VSQGSCCAREIELSSHSLASRRHFHSAVVHNGSMYVFGGKSNGYMNDLLCFHFGSYRLVPAQIRSDQTRSYRTSIRNAITASHHSLQQTAKRGP
jgi:hypothetical protein